MQPKEYLIGLIRSEALNFVHNLPGLTRQEFAELIEAAEKKPLTRSGTVEQKETVELRIRYFVEFLKRQPNGATRQQIAEALKYNGSNMYYSINEAIERGLIYATKGNGNQRIYKAVRKARAMSGKRW